MQTAAACSGRSPLDRPECGPNCASERGGPPRFSGRGRPTGAARMTPRRYMTGSLAEDPRRSALAAVLLAALTLAEAAALLAAGAFVDFAAGAGEPAAGPFGWARRMIEAAGLGLPGAIGLLAGALLLRAWLAWLYAELSTAIGSRRLHRLRMTLYRAASQARWRAAAGMKRNELHHALSMAPAQLAAGAELTLRFVMALASAGLAAGLALTVDPALVAMVGAVAGLIGLPMLWFDRRAARGARDLVDTSRRLYDHVGRYLDNARLDRFQAARGGGAAQFDAASAAQAEASRALALVEHRSALVRQTGGALGLVAALGLGASRDMSGAEAALIAVLFLRLLPRLFSAHQLYQKIVAASAAWAEFETQRARFEAEAEPRGARIDAARPPRIEARGVTFAWPGQETPALRDVSLVLPAGRAVGLIGLSGAGKTTLADVVCGLLAPASGAVLIDGAPLPEAAQADWRARVALASRDDFLMPDTVAANLRMGGDASDAALWEALDLVGFRARIEAMGGLSARIGDRGDGLSAGERQRLCLARALAQDPWLLVLDEATSALNPVDERAICARLAGLRGRCTVLVIAHRLSAIDWVDRVAALEAGRLVEEGPREALTGQGLWARMAEAGR